MEKSRIVEDFNLLIANGVIGIYTCCEVTEIFLYTNCDKQNILTLIVFENVENSEFKGEYLTKNLMKFNKFKNHKWGIKRTIISIAECQKIFNELASNNKLKICDQKNIIGNLEFTGKTFVPSDNEEEKIPLNKVLKNNSYNGSYIIEGFDNSKVHLDFLLSAALEFNKFGEEVSSVIPIELGALSDRLGNIIFQFPINVMKVERGVIKPNVGITFNISLKENEERKMLCQIINADVADKTTTDIALSTLNIGDNKIIIKTDKLVEYKIYDQTNNLILHSGKFVTTRQMSITLAVVSLQKRVFRNNNLEVEIDVQSSTPWNNNTNKENQHDWKNSRVYENQLNELEKNKSFLQFTGNSNTRAVSDIRTLINQYGKKGVCLWDPYLSAEDIKNILYYNQDSNSNMRAITQVKGKKADEYKNTLSEDNIHNLNMNLEFRNRFNIHNEKFHDRFIIFIGERTRAWSLGTSVNSLGKSHHILQEVKHAMHILNAFNRLWDKLDKEECIIWKSTQ